MTRFRLLGAMALVAATSAPLTGQGVSLTVYGGGYSAAKTLRDAPKVDFGTGFLVGGGLAISVNKFLALRGDFGFAHNEGNDPREVIPNANGSYNRFLYGGDLQLRLPIGGVVPYVFGGGGAVTIDPELDDAAPDIGEHFTKPAGRFGAGLEITPQDWKLGLFVQGTAWLFTFDRIQFDTTQFDVTYTAGISLKLFGS